MSVYTTQVRFICESLAGVKDQLSTGYPSIEETIKQTHKQIFSFSYPFWDINDKDRFESSFLRHFWTREIGAETVGLWKLQLQDWLNVNMPKYNGYYIAQTADYDPLTDYNENRQYDKDSNLSRGGSGTVQNNGTTSESGDNMSKILDTPQNGIQDLLDGSYLTSASSQTGSASSSVNNTQTTTNNFNDTGAEHITETITGKRGAMSYPEMLMKYRESLVSADQAVFQAMSPLFMGLWQ